MKKFTLPFGLSYLSLGILTESAFLKPSCFYAILGTVFSQVFFDMKEKAQSTSEKKKMEICLTDPSYGIKV